MTGRLGPESSPPPAGLGQVHRPHGPGSRSEKPSVPAPKHQRTTELKGDATPRSAPTPAPASLVQARDASETQPGRSRRFFKSSRAMSRLSKVDDSRALADRSTARARRIGSAILCERAARRHMAGNRSRPRCWSGGLGGVRHGLQQGSKRKRVCSCRTGPNFVRFHGTLLHSRQRPNRVLQSFPISTLRLVLRQLPWAMCDKRALG